MTALRFFDADGNALGGAYIVERHRVGTLTSPQIAWVGTSRAFVAVWLAEAGQDGVGTDIFGRLLGAEANPEGREFRVSLPAAHRGGRGRSTLLVRLRVVLGVREAGRIEVVDAGPEPPSR